MKTKSFTFMFTGVLVGVLGLSPGAHPTTMFWTGKHECPVANARDYSVAIGWDRTENSAKPVAMTFATSGPGLLPQRVHIVKVYYWYDPDRQWKVSATIKPAYAGGPYLYPVSAPYVKRSAQAVVDLFDKDGKFICGGRSPELESS